jgi:hypothetical protein
MLNVNRRDESYRIIKKKEGTKGMETLMTNTVVCFVVGKLKVL